MYLNEELENCRILEQLVGRLTPREFHERSVTLLRQWVRAHPQEINIDIRTALTHPLLTQLREEHPEVESRTQSNVLGELLFISQGVESVEPCDWAGFAHWLFGRSGIFCAVGPHSGDGCVLPYRGVLTATGRRFLSGEDYPLYTEALARIIERCPGLPDAVAEHLHDAHECLKDDHVRPTISILGLAFEVTIEAASDHLIPDIQDAGTATRIHTLRQRAEQLVPGRRGPHRDHRGAFITALDFADELRRRRNDAVHAHAVWGFEDREEAEDLFRMALLHLPRLWWPMHPV